MLDQFLVVWSVAQIALIDRLQYVRLIVIHFDSISIRLFQEAKLLILSNSTCGLRRLITSNQTN